MSTDLHSNAASPSVPAADTARWWRLSVWLVLLTGLALCLIRFVGPFDLIDKDQQNPTAYVVDVIQNGNWICQRDSFGGVTSKPPMYTWLAALVSLPFGWVSRLSVTMPAAVSTLAISWILLVLGRNRFGWQAGLFAALFYICSPLASRQMGLIRTDGLFSLTVMLAAWMAFQSWQSGRGWHWFWLAAVAASLTKGPLGLLLAAGGLLAVIWERRSGTPQPLRGSHWLGISLFLLFGVGWFGLAYGQVGQELITKMIHEELVTQAVPGEHFHVTWQNLFKPLLYCLSRFAPWCLLACFGLWRVCRQPAEDDLVRRFERFIFCWFMVGLAIFTLGSHKRGDLIFPIIPPLALLAGREMARWCAAWSARSVLAGAGLLAILTLTVNAAIYDFWTWREVRVIQTGDAASLAQSVRERVGLEFPVTYAGRLYAPEFFLNSMRPLASYDSAAVLLRGPVPAFVVVDDLEELLRKLGPDQTKVHELIRRPASGRPTFTLVSNQPRLEWTESVVMCIGRVELKLEHARLIRVRDREFLFRGDSGAAALLTNHDLRPMTVRVGFQNGPGSAWFARQLAPGESWRVTARGSGE